MNRNLHYIIVAAVMSFFLWAIMSDAEAATKAKLIEKPEVCIFIPVEVHYSKTNISHQSIKACAPYGTPVPKQVKKIIVKKVG